MVSLLFRTVQLFNSHAKSLGQIELTNFLSLSADSVPRVGHNNTCLVPKLKNLCLGPLTSATKLFLPQPEPYSSVSSVSRHCHQLHHHGPDTCSASRSQTRSDEERREIVKLHDVSSDTELHLALTICVVSTLY